MSIKAVIENEMKEGELVGERRQSRIKGPENGMPLDGIPPGGWDGGPGNGQLPENCQIIPLGVAGNNYVFLDASSQYRVWKFSDLSQSGVESLFGGDRRYLCWGWPRFVKKRKENKGDPDEFEVTGYKADYVRADLMAVCHDMGIWDGVDRLRGRGAWAGRDGGLVLHCGNKVVGEGGEKEPAMIDNIVYPALGALPKPLSVSVSAHDDGQESVYNAAFLLELFRTWNWKRPDVDPILLLGEVGVLMIGGALPWRTSSYIVGGAGTGKSTVMDIIKTVLDGWAIKSSNATAAGIYQKIGYDALGVILDEMEASSDNRKTQAVIQLMRQAASGDLILRGGSDHNGVDFQSRSAYLFGAIKMVPLENQDFTRIALLELMPLPKDQPSPALNDKKLAMTGRVLLRQIMESWHTFDDVYEKIAAELAQGGHSQRGQKTFGTLLTMATLMLGEKHIERLAVPLGQDLSCWRKWLRREALVEYQNSLENWHECLNHLLTTHIDKWTSGMKGTIGKQILAFHDDPVGRIPDEINLRLEQADCTLKYRKNVWWLAVPNTSATLKKLYADTDWVGGTHGGWGNAFRQWPCTAELESEKKWLLAQARVNGPNRNCTFISLDALFGKHGDDSDNGLEL